MATTKVTTGIGGFGNLTLAQGDILYRDGTALTNLAAGTSGQFLKTQGSAANPIWATAAGITSGTTIATTSGTTADFTGLAGAKLILISIAGFSTNGTSAFNVIIGDSGGFETSGYASGGIDWGTGGGSNSTTAFQMGYAMVAANTNHGIIVLQLVDAATFQWVMNGTFMMTSGGGNGAKLGAGTKSLSAALTQVRITTASGDTFDAGAINIVWF